MFESSLVKHAMIAIMAAGTFMTVSVATRNTNVPAPRVTAKAVAPTCGGQPNIQVSGALWTCTFDSEFIGTSLNTTQWAPIVTATSGYTSGVNACYVNSPNNISVGSGYLSLTVRKEAAPFTCDDPRGNFTTQYTSGYVTTSGLFSQAYGQFEVDAKVPSTSVIGLQSSFWLYPQNGTLFGPWPASGEIDIAETYSQYPGLAIPYIHYDATASEPLTAANVVTSITCSINANAFNDYVVTWVPGTITMTYNGQTCLVDHWSAASPESGLEPFDQPFFINLTQALGVGVNQFNPGATPVPATTEVRFVRVWGPRS